MAKNKRADQAGVRATPAPQAEAAAGFALRPALTRTVLGVILAGSAALGLWCLWSYRASPYYSFSILDEASFIKWARVIAGGQVIGREAFYLDPLYPYTLAAIFRGFGPGLLAVRLFQIALGTASVGLVFWTARKLKGDLAGLLAAATLALYHGLYFYELLILKGIMDVFFAAAACALGVAAADRPQGRWRWLGLGATLGALTLLRGNFQALLPFALLFAFFIRPHDPLPSRALRAGLAALGMAGFIAPVTIRNYAVSGELILTTSQAGANFYIGNNEHAHGDYTILSFVRPDPEFERGDFAREASRRAGRELSPAEVSRFWFGEALAWMRGHPGDALRLTVRKAWLMINHFEVPDNYNYQFTRKEFIPQLGAAFMGFGLWWGPALIGMAVMVRRDRRAIFPAGFMVLYAATIIPFFIVDRYRLVAAPPAALLAAGAVVWAIEQGRRRSFTSLAAAGAVTALTLTTGFWPLPGSRAGDAICRFNLGRTYLELNQPRLALRWLDRAAKISPDDPDTAAARAEALRRLNAAEIDTVLRSSREPGRSVAELIEQGKRLEQLGQTPDAAELYERAAARDPAALWPHGRLAWLYRSDPLCRDLPRARAHLEAGLALAPDQPDLINGMAEYYYLMGDYAQARSWWRKLLQVDPANALARRRLEELGR
jgi:4-amino-4-deoxy-L-arabinose transferase-like glycosyltransferase/Flp pilus assembly protein TadD